MEQQAERVDEGGYAQGRGTVAVMQRRYVLTEAGRRALRRREVAGVDMSAIQDVLDRAHGVRTARS